MPPQRPFQQKRINGRVRSITEMNGHSSILGARDTADRMQRAGIAPYAGMHGAASRTRADNIAAARADGTFDAKRNAFNAANKGSYMDEAGRIGPRAPGTGGGAASPAAATSFVSAPDGQGGSKQVKIQTPGGMVAAASSPKPAAPQPAVTASGPMGPFKPRPKDAPFTSMPPGSRDLYAEEKAREAKPASMVAAASAPDPVMKQAEALGNAAKIANSRETAAVMAKAKASLPAKPTSMVAAASAPKPTPQEMGKKLIAMATPDQWDQAANKPKPMTPPEPSGAAFGAARSKPLVAAAVSQPKAPAVAAQAQAVIPKTAATTTAPAAPKPSWLDKKIAANPDGIFGKVADVAGKAKRGFVSAANAVAPVAANALASYYNATVANPANAIRGAIKERAEDAPTGAAAKLAKKLTGMSDEASMTAKKKAKPIVIASN